MFFHFFFILTLQSLFPPSSLQHIGHNFLSPPCLSSFQKSDPFLKNSEKIWQDIILLCSSQDTDSTFLDLKKKVLSLGDSFSLMSHQHPIDLLKICMDQQKYQSFIFLIQNGADPNKKDKTGNTLLSYSIFWGKWEFIVPLIQSGADFHFGSSIGTPLYLFIKRNAHIRIQSYFLIQIFVHYLLAQGVDPNCLKSSIRTSSKEMAQKIHHEFFRERGGRIDEQLPLFGSCLQTSLNGTCQLYYILKSYGMNLLQKDFDGNSALHYLAKVFQTLPDPLLKSTSFMLELNHLWDDLIQHGVDPYAPNVNHETAFYKRQDTLRNLSLGAVDDNLLTLREERRKLSIIENIPLLEDVFYEFQTQFPLPYDRDIRAGHILWKMLDIVANKVSQTPLHSETFIHHYLQRTLPTGLILRPPSPPHLESSYLTQTVPLDMLILFGHGLKHHPDFRVASFFNDILRILLKKNKNDQFVYEYAMTNTGKEYLYFFDPESLKKGELSLNIPQIHLKWTESHPCVVSWALLMNVEEGLALSRYDFNSNRSRRFFSPIRYMDRLTEASIERLPLIHLSQHLYAKSERFNTLVLDNASKNLSLKTISHLDELLETIKTVVSEEKFQHIQQTFPLTLDQAQWEAHGRSLVFNPSLPSHHSTDSFYEWGIKLRKKDEFQTDFSDYEVLHQCHLQGGFKHLRPLGKWRLGKPLKTQIETYLNTHQIDEEQTFEIEGTFFLYESDVPYFIYLRDIYDKSTFLHALQSNIRQTIQMYSFGYIRNDLTCSQHDIDPRTARRSLYYLPVWDCSYYFYNKGVVSNRESLTKLSNFGLSIRDPGNYVKSSSLLKFEQMKQFSQSQFIYLHSKDRFTQNFIVDALLELVDIAFEHYLDFYIKNETPPFHKDQMIDELIHFIIRPLLEENCPFISQEEWDGFIDELRGEIEVDIDLFITHAPFIDIAIMKKITRENLLQNTLTSLNRCYCLIATYLGDEEGLRAVLAKKNETLKNKQKDTKPFFETNESHSFFEENKFLIESFLPTLEQHLLTLISQNNHEQLLKAIWFILLQRGEQEVINILKKITFTNSSVWVRLLYSSIITHQELLTDLCLDKMIPIDPTDCFFKLHNLLWNHPHKTLVDDFLYKLFFQLNTPTQEKIISLIDLKESGRSRFLKVACRLNNLNMIATLLLKKFLPHITSLEDTLYPPPFDILNSDSEQIYLHFLEFFQNSQYESLIWIFWKIQIPWKTILKRNFKSVLTLLFCTDPFQKGIFTPLHKIQNDVFTAICSSKNTDHLNFFIQLPPLHLHSFISSQKEIIFSQCLSFGAFNIIDSLIDSHFLSFDQPFDRTIFRATFNFIIQHDKEGTLFIHLLHAGLPFSLDDCQICIDLSFFHENWTLANFLFSFFHHHFKEPISDSFIESLFNLCIEKTIGQPFWNKEEGILLLERWGYPIEKNMTSDLLEDIYLRGDEKMIDYFFKKAGFLLTDSQQLFIESEALIKAIENNASVQMVQQILERGGLHSYKDDPNLLKHLSFYERFDLLDLLDQYNVYCDIEKLIQDSLDYGHIQIIEWLIKKNKIPRHLPSHLFCLDRHFCNLSQHCRSNQIKIVSLLFRQGIRVSLSINFLKSLFGEAFLPSSASFFQNELIFNNQEIWTLFKEEHPHILFEIAQSAFYFRAEWCQFLLKKGFFEPYFLNQINKKDESALFIALRFGQYDLVRFLLERGIDYQRVNFQKQTVLNCLLQGIESGLIQIKDILWMELIDLFIDEGIQLPHSDLSFKKPSEALLLFIEKIKSSSSYPTKTFCQLPIYLNRKTTAQPQFFC